MKFLPFLTLLLTLVACSQQPTQELEQLRTDLQAAQAQLALAEQTAGATPGLIHSVFFWLKEDLSEVDKAAYLAGVQSLTAIESVKSCYIGPPAKTEERGVVDNSYSYALIVHFEDLAGHDAYQIDPIHLKFVEDHKDKWTKVVVYDNVIVE